MKTQIKILNNNAYLDIYNEYDTDTIILIFPGGGYNHVSEREATPISNKFIGFGYNAAILYYSCERDRPFKNKEPLDEANEAIKILNERYKNIFVLGFSAGGHLAATCATGEASKSIKGMLLAYPVITFKEKTHEMTRRIFLNNNITKENILKYSVEERVNQNTPSCFVFASTTDASVPYENTLMLVEALKKYNIYYECMIFNEGVHGCALADETAIKDGDTSFVNKKIAVWPYKADEFIKKVLANEKND